MHDLIQYFSMNEKEIWYDIPGYAGVYQLSNLGNVKSLERRLIRSNGRRIHIKERILKQSLNNGYLQVCLKRNGESRTFGVHQLVALVFIPNPNNLPCVLHIDNNQQNNCVLNLRWGTQLDNITQAWNEGRCENLKIKTTYGERNGNNVLTEREVKEIKQKYIPRQYTRKQLAKEYNVHRTTIDSILGGKTWNHS
jgi:NUMOD4 motif